MFIFENFRRLRVNTLQKIKQKLHFLFFDIQRCCDPGWSDTVFYSFADHEVFLDGTKAVDLVVIGKSFIILRDQTKRFCFPKLFEGIKTQMPVKDMIVASLPLLGVDNQRLDHANFSD